MPRASVRTVIALHQDLLYLETLRGLARGVFPAAAVEASNRVGRLRQIVPEHPAVLIIAGIDFPDGDILDTFSLFSRERRPFPRALLVADTLDQRTVAALHGLPIAGVFDPRSDGQPQLCAAMIAVAGGAGYWSQTARTTLLRHFVDRSSIQRLLTPTEQLVLSVLGDGSDDQTAALQLGLKPSSVLSVRRELHRKLNVHTQGHLVRLAGQYGFVKFLPDQVVRPGYEMLREARHRPRRPGTPETVPADHP